MRHSTRPLFIVYILISAALNYMVPPAMAQEIKFNHLSLEEGLSQSSVYSILQDRQGFMWFGTQDGLNYWDGYAFKVYRHDPQDPTSLSNSFVQSIYEDHAGRLWVGTWGGGLNLFDSRTNTFEHYKSDPANPTSLSDNRVYTIYEDRDHRLWIGTGGGGLNLLNAETKTFKRYRHDPKSASSLSNDVVSCIYEDSKGQHWVGTWGGCLNLFDVDAKTFEHFDHDPRNPLSLSSHFVLSIHEDRNGWLWVGTQGGGLNRYDPESKTFERFIYEPENPSTLSDHVHSIYEDRSGRLWLGTWVSGLNLFDPQTKKIKNYRHDPKNATSLSNDWVNTLYEDAQGRLWVGTMGGGINILDFAPKRFTTFRNDPSDPSSLMNNFIYAIYEDHNGRLWVGTWGGGLNLFDPGTNTFVHYKHIKSDPTTLSANSIYSIHEDHSGRLWVGTDRGVNLFNERNKTFEHYDHDPENPLSLSGHLVTTIYEDRSNQLWIGTDGGLNLFNPKSKTFERFIHIPTNATSLSNSHVNSIQEDHVGRMWVGTEGGLNLFDTKSKTFRRFLNHPTDSTSLSNDQVNTIYEDANNRLWVGTDDGLNLYDSVTKTFSVYREEQGLPNNVIYGILEDSLGRLWISTYKGISRFTPPATFDDRHIGVFRNYDITDGLQNNEFNAGAYFKGKDGRMYFGGTNGFNVFDPDSINDDLHVPPIVLTGLEIFNKPVTPGKEYNGFVLPMSITLANELILSYRESVFTLEFSTLSYAQPEKNKYAYKLQGFDKDWNYTDAKRRFATYTNLDPGTYIFHVKGSNHDGIWNEEGRILKIIISPPWWETWWFRTLSLLSLFGVAILIFVLRTKGIRNMNTMLAETVDQKTKELQATNLALVEQDEEIKSQNTVLKEQREELAAQNEELSNLNTEKDNLISIVAHDLKSPLNQIKGLTGIIKISAAKIDTETSSYIQMIEDSARRLTSMIDKILDVEAIESRQLNLTFEYINFSEEVQSIIERFRIEAQKKQIQIHSSLTENIEVKLDRGYLDEIIENLLSNAIKFSPARKNIYVTSTVQEGKVVCSIRDEGPGLNKEDKKKLFGKYQKLSAKPTGSETSTGLGLSIVKKFVEAMSGKIGCESEVGKGAIFFVEFAIAKRP